jgi:hypothetical protein
LIPLEVGPFYMLLEKGKEMNSKYHICKNEFLRKIKDKYKRKC